MSALSSIAALPLVALPSPSIAQVDPNVCSKPELAARFEDLCARYRARWEYDRVTPTENDEDSELDVWSALSNESAALGKEILSVPAMSIADIALQARAVALENNDMWWGTADHMHTGQLFTRLLIDRICQLAGVSVFGYTATAPVTPLVMPDDPLTPAGNDPSTALARETRETFERMEIQGLRLSSAKKAMAQWERRNPKPVMREVTFPEDVRNIVNERIRLMNEKVSLAEIDQMTQDPNADLKAAMTEHAKTLKIWRQQWSLARRQSGVEREEAEYAHLTNAFDDTVERLEAIQARTLQGLVAKARAADHTEDAMIAWSLVRDVDILGERGLSVAA